MLGNLIGGFIVIIVGVSLIPTVADNVVLAQTNGSGVKGGVGANVSGASATILDLVVLFFALGIMSAGVALTVGGLKNAGIM